MRLIAIMGAFVALTSSMEMDKSTAMQEKSNIKLLPYRNYAFASMIYKAKPYFVKQT